MLDLVGIGETAIRLAERLGVNEAEAFVSQIGRKELTFRDVVEAGCSTTLFGVGVRTVIGKRTGFSCVSSVERSDIESAVRASMSIAKASDPDPEWVSLPSKYGREHVESVLDRKIATLDPGLLVETSSSVIHAVRERDKRLSVTRSYLTASVLKHAIVNSHGCKLTRSESLVSYWVAVRAEDSGKKAVSNETFQGRTLGELDAEGLAVRAGDRAIAMMEAAPISSRGVAVVWRNDVFAELIELMIGRTVTADAVQKKRSPWAGKLGEEIAHESISLVDEGLRKGGVGTRAFDDEGVPQRTTPVVEKGVLRSYLYDVYTANKEKRASTGNARRDIGIFTLIPNYTRTPSPLPTNLVLQPGDATPEEIVEETRDGLYIVETIGEWLSNPISGELTATVTNGFLIRNGEMTQPVKGVIVSGNIFNILKGKMDLLGDDLTNSQTAYAPTARIIDMTVAGE